MSFGEALDAIKAGAVARRFAWSDGETILVVHAKGILKGRKYIGIREYVRNERRVDPWVPRHDDLLAEDWSVV